MLYVRKWIYPLMPQNFGRPEEKTDSMDRRDTRAWGPVWICICALRAIALRVLLTKFHSAYRLGECFSSSAKLGNPLFCMENWKRISRVCLARLCWSSLGCDHFADRQLEWVPKMTGTRKGRSWKIWQKPWNRISSDSKLGQGVSWKTINQVL